MRRLVGSGVGRAGGVHLAFESSDWLFGYRKLDCIRCWQIQTFPILCSQLHL